MSLTSHNPDQRRKESLCISITVSKVEKDQPSSLNSCEDPLPGMLFFLPPGQHLSDCSQLNESTTREASEASQLEDAAGGDSASEEKVGLLSHLYRQPLLWKVHYQCLRHPVGRSRCRMTSWRPDLKSSSFWSLSSTWLFCPTTLW